VSRRAEKGSPGWASRRDFKESIVQLENIATPQEDSTPQLRYASLHRAVERGMASNEVLSELAIICLQLGHHDEAVRIHGNMTPGAIRDHVGSKLVRRGLISRSAAGGAAGLDDDDFGDDRDPSIREHVLDSVQFLCQSHMPAVALLTMLAFPVVVGLGGFMTSGGSPWLFAALATLPGLCVLGVVGAMGRHIFLQSSEGEEEVPAIPAPAEMVLSARRYLGDVSIVLGALVAPSLTLLWFGAPLVSSLPGLLLGMFLVPIALILRQIRGDIGALSPVAMVRGIGCCRGYSKVTAAFWLAFAPAAIAFWSSLGNAVWLQIAIVGPLAVLPTFAAARLLGTFTEVHRARLGLLLYPQGRVNQSDGAAPSSPRPANPALRKAAHTPLQKQVGAARKPFAAKAPQPQPQPAARAVQTAAQRLAAPRASVSKAPPPPPTLPVKPPEIVRKAIDATPQPNGLTHKLRPEDWMVEQSPRRAPAAHIEGRAPKTRAQQVDPQQLARKPVRRTAPAPVEDSGLPGPDLSNIPGATIITGEDRERLGAASRKT
jgi:hypothetical protein